MEIIDRKTALDAGLKRYFNGVPCPRGHIAQRYTSINACVACAELSKLGKLEPLTIYQVGYNSAKRGTGFPARVNKKIQREYDHWRRMLQRSYDPKWKELHPTYGQCSVEESWWDYQQFARDFHECEFRTEGSDLDKDLLYIGNKIYSKETCVYLPEEINKTIIIQGSVFNYHKRDEVFEFACNGVYLGRSDNPLGLADKWVDHKLSRIYLLADKYKSVIDPRAYESLMNFRISFDKEGKVYRE